jgi:hypothetical protein
MKSNWKPKIVISQDQVILVTYGRWSESRFMLLSTYQTFLKTIEPSERACVMVTPTDYDPSDLDFMQKSNEIIGRLELDIKEQREMVVTRLKQRKRA